MVLAMTERSLVSAKATLVIASIGYLVPRSGFDGVVHSVYARACNISCGESLLMLLSPDAPEGPTTLLLRNDSALDLRSCFQVGDAVVQSGARLLSNTADACASGATVWKPRALATRVEPSQLAVNLCAARARIAAQLEHGGSVLHREARPTCARVERACRDCELEQALLEATRLIGWGEGLTPAGDDFLVGLMSGLDALAVGSDARRGFLSRLGAAIAARTARTTRVAAHYLRLAAQGHFTANVHALRAALLSTNDVASVQRSVDAALRFGATSGADLATGMLSGVSAWCYPPSSDQGRL
jgi:uncharacterized protein DUF2877